MAACRRRCGFQPSNSAQLDTKSVRVRRSASAADLMLRSNSALHTHTHTHNRIDMLCFESGQSKSSPTAACELNSNALGAHRLISISSVPSGPSAMQDALRMQSRLMSASSPNAEPASARAMHRAHFHINIICMRRYRKP